MDEVLEYATLPQRIQGIYNSCSENEKKYLIQILQEISDTGYSKTYEDIWLADYKCIPVDIDTFLESDEFLGKSTRQGTAVYPAWRNVMRDIFNSGNKYSEVVLTGATRIGKSSTAVKSAAYMLYKLMCMRSPHEFFGIETGSKISITFFNLTKPLAMGVAFREFNDMLKASPWFNQHGTFSQSLQNFYYIPEGGDIVIDWGTDATHALGKQSYIAFMDECLKGDTVVVTDEGNFSIESLEGKTVNVLQYNPHNGSTDFVPANVVKTKEVTRTIKITLENGGTIEGTPEHPIMLSNGKYNLLGEITEGAYVKDLQGGIKVVYVETRLFSNSIPVYDVISAKPYHNFVIDVNGKDVVVHNCNFSKTGVKDVSKAKGHMKATYTTASARVKGTFKHGGDVFGKVFAVSSKRSDSDFMEVYVQEQLAAGAGDHMFIFGAPQWEVKPAHFFSKERFWIAVGDRSQKSFVVPDNQCFPEALDELRSQGFQLLSPPIDMKSDFIADFMVALRDLAGIAVVGTMSYITQAIIDPCISKTRKSPFYQDIIQTGTKDRYTIEEFFHISELPREVIKSPVYIHLDLATVNDRAGIGAVSVTGRKETISPNGTKTYVPTLSHVFSVGIEAPRGDKIPYNKIMQFMCYLRKAGLNIQGISRDQFQSDYMAELLEGQGFNVTKLSVDRVTGDTQEAYDALKTLLLEQRIDMLEVRKLIDELVMLQRDASGRIDHLQGKEYGKDIADGLAGSVWNAILSNPSVGALTTQSAKVIADVNRRRSPYAQTNRNVKYGNELSRMFPNLYNK